MEISLIGKRIHIPKLVSDWLEFDRAFSAKVMAGDWTKMTRKELGYAETQLLIVAVALASCGTIIQGQDKPIETSPAVAKPQIAFFTKDTIKGDPALQSQLTGVQGLSGKGAGCNPAVIMVEGGNAGGETAGFCTKDNVVTNVVVRRDRTNGTQQTVNEDLITRAHTGSDGKTDMVYIEYGSGDKKDTLFTYDPATKVTTWHFTSGGIVEFPAAKGPFEELVGKLLEPGNVAVAAEIDTRTPTATLKSAPKPTETLTPFLTPTEKPTLVPTEKPTATPSFVENGHVKPDLPIIFNGSDFSDWAKLPRDAKHNILTGQVVRFSGAYGIERAGMAAVVYATPYFENGDWYIPLMADTENGVVKFKLNIGGDGVHGSPFMGIFEVNNGRWGNNEGWPTVDPIANKDLFKPGVELAFDFWLKFDPGQCKAIGADGPTCDRYKLLMAEYGPRLNELASGSPLKNGDEIGLVNNLAIAVKK